MSGLKIGENVVWDGDGWRKSWGDIDYEKHQYRGFVTMSLERLPEGDHLIVPTGEMPPGEQDAEFGIIERHLTGEPGDPHRQYEWRVTVAS